MSGGLDAQEAIEGLQEIDDHEQHRAHAQAHPEKLHVLAEQVAVDDEGGRAPPGGALEPRPTRGRPNRSAAQAGADGVANAPEPVRPAGGQAGGGRPHERHPRGEEQGVGKPHRERGGDAAPQGRPFQRREDEVVGDDDAQARREGDTAAGAAAVMAADAQRKAEQHEHEGGHGQREALVELHVVRRHQLPLGGEGAGLGPERAGRSLALGLVSPGRRRSAATPAAGSCRRG